MTEYFDIDFKVISQADKTANKKYKIPYKPEEPWFSSTKESNGGFFPYLSINKTKITPPKVGNVTKPFDNKTMSLMYKVPHKTNLLNVAQEHLGIQEVTEKEYEKLTPEEKQNTQMHLIGKYGNPSHQWCAHTVSHISEEAGMNIGPHKMSVKQFIDWANSNNSYKPVSEPEITKNNYKQVRAIKEKQIIQQTKNMHEGDFIIWKSPYVAELPNGQLAEVEASHIGIIEAVNADGSVTIIEGNANESRTGITTERYPVSFPIEGVMGNQVVGEFQEINRRDGLIRKVYTPKELAAFGYSGYIDNSKIIK